MDLEKRFFEMICAFPTMVRKGVKDGDIPGVGPDWFCADELAEFVYNGGGRAWSSGEKLVLELLLNLYNPGAYDRFNLGHAVNVWDPSHMKGCLLALAIHYGGQ